MKRIVGNFTSRLFQPVSVVPKNSEIKHKLLPKSQKLMVDTGLIRQSSPGVFSYLPLGLRVLNKLIALVDKHMKNIGAQKIQLSNITEGHLWKATGRWDLEQLELFKFKDRHGKDYLLSPTHEESIAGLLASLQPLSYKLLPLLLYQVTSKYRDELKPRCGLIRSRDFMMKDLYSFDEDEASAEQTYYMVLDAYRDFFDQLSVPYTVAEGSSGEMGGSLSHEFHYECDIGEDTLRKCTQCAYASNIQLTTSHTSHNACPQCGSQTTTINKTVEVGHTFKLGKKYSEALSACYSSKEGKRILEMGSYGLGLSRIIAASVEALSLPDQIRWPRLIAPFSSVIIPPKEGSREAEACGDLHLNIYEHLNELELFRDDILVDDRPGFTIGRKLHDCERMGYPWAIVIGSMTANTPNLLELRDIKKKQSVYMSVSELVHHLSQEPQLSDMTESQ